jgi:lysine-specific demethylase 8
MSRQEFVEEHLKRHVPVVVRGLQRDAPISSLTTQDDVLAAVGDLVIQVQANYTSPLAGARTDVRRQGLSQKVRNAISEMPLRDYCKHVRENPDTDLLCVEYPTPADLLDRMKVPDYCELPWSAEPLVSFMFVANKGNYAHLHFDGDFRGVLLYQVFGRKRVVMVPLEAQDKISPSMNFSKLLLQNLEESEKLHLLRYLGAYDCLISPGDTVFFPPSIWHYVEYLDNGMSVNFRFGREEFARQCVDANRVPFYPDLHLMLARLSRVKDGRQDRERTIWAQLEQTLGQAYPTTRERHYAVQEMYRSLADSLPGGKRPALISADCLIAEAMAIERYESESTRWRTELRLGTPI